MLRFTSDHTLYQRYGFFLFILQLNLFIFGLIPFHYGIWVKSEPMMLALYATSALSSLWLLVGLKKGLLENAGSFLQPVPLCIALWLGWQFICLLAAPLPWRMWFGPPQIGEGMAWYVAVMLSCLVASPLWRKAYYRENLLFYASMTLLVLAQLHLLNTEDNSLWRPWSWSDYLIFMYGWLFVAIMSVPVLANKKIYGVAGVLLALMLWTSDNDAGNILVPYAALITAIAVWCRKQNLPHFSSPGKLWRLLAMIACLVPMAWMAGDTKASWFPDRWHGVNARQELNLMGLEALRRDPGRWLAGGGWDGFADDQFRYKITETLKKYDDAAIAAQPEGLTIDEFHSHNQPMEALLSLGLVGFVLWFAIPLGAIWCLPAALFWRCAPMIVAVTLTTYFWFYVPQLFAFQALFWVALCAACEAPDRVTGAHNRRIMALVFLAGVAMVWTVRQQVDAMQYAHKTYWTIFAAKPATHSQDLLRDDAKRSGNRFAQIALLWLETRNQLRFHDLSHWYEPVITAAHRLALSPQVGPYVAFKELEIKNKLFLEEPNPYLVSYRAGALASYPEMIERLARQAPTRENLAVPYLRLVAEKLHTHPDKEYAAWLEHIIALAPDFSSALWVLGEYKTKNPATAEEGRRLQRRALELGVEKIYPLTPAQLKALQP